MEHDWGGTLREHCFESMLGFATAMGSKVETLLMKGAARHEQSTRYDGKWHSECTLGWNHPRCSTEDEMAWQIERREQQSWQSMT
jgi:hypothetical protein